ncbi:alcohol dehydrogenase catalytic domain-containing protein [Cryptosporangium sp. NPDC048952]|uniref:alcohol dehydrogenase catalytic domain-containing protein n=1 Tax=Cryptosporangium sp. NPDC048952 TaxID=3363961 RepID=UPI003720259E
MRAIVQESLAPIEQNPLHLREREIPTPGPGQVLVRVAACGVCRSNLHMIEGDWAPATPAFLPIVPGHEVVGTIERLGADVTALSVGDRVGVNPLFSTCGNCEFCWSGRDQLCQSKQITGETVDGGYAEYLVSDQRFTFPLPDEVEFADAAPLFCPGITAIGAVSKVAPAPGMKIAVFGVGGVGHLVLQFARLHGADTYAVARSRDHLALGEDLGAAAVDASAGDAAEQLLKAGGVDASVVLVSSAVVVDQALRATRPGGTVVLGANAPVGDFAFAVEKTVVGSLLGTRQQMREVLALAAAGKIKAECEPYPLEEATTALTRLKNGQIRARAVLMP